MLMIILKTMTQQTAAIRMISQVNSLDSKVDEQTHQLDSLNMSIFDIERNTSAQLELEHKDVVSLAVSELYITADNRNRDSVTHCLTLFRARWPACRTTT